MKQRTLVPDAGEVVLDRLMVESNRRLVMVLRATMVGNFTSPAIFPIGFWNWTRPAEMFCGPGTWALPRSTWSLAGKKIYVSNWGGRRPDADSVTGPAAGDKVRVDDRCIASEGSVSVIDLASGSPAPSPKFSPACTPARWRCRRTKISRRRQRRQRHVERD